MEQALATTAIWLGVGMVGLRNRGEVVGWVALFAMFATGAVWD